MCTGVSPKRIATRIVFTSWIHWKLLRNFCCIQGYWHNCYQVSLITQQWNNLYLISLERRWSSRTFRYGYLVTTSPSYRSCLRQLPPCGWVTDFGHYQLPWCDGRCVQDPGTYSPRHSDSRLLAIPASCSRVADCSPNWDVIFEICSPSQARFPLFTPL